MINNKTTAPFWLLVSLILFAAFSRIVPHTPNFSPLGAIAVFGAAYFTQKWKAFVIPLTATWLSDLFINNVIYHANYPSFTWLSTGFYWQYGAYILITLASLFILKSVTNTRIILGSLTATVLFFLVSNFGCWPGNYYPQTAAGLMQCYAAGIPFIKGTFLGDAFYTAVLFGAYQIISNKYLKGQEVKG